MRKKIVLSILSLFIVCYSASAQLYVNQYNNAGIGTLGNASSSLYIINDYTGTSEKIGVRCKISGGDNRKVGFFNSWQQDNNKASKGMYTNITHNSTEGVDGIYSTITANNINKQANGLVNSLRVNSGSGESAGIRNIITTHGSGRTFGIVNSLKNSSGSGERRGISNELRTNTSIVANPEPNYGIYNSIVKYNNSEVVGERVALKIEDGAQGNAYGIRSTVWTSNTANVNTLNGNNALYAVKGEINSGLYGYAAHFTANQGYAGWFQGDVEVTGQLTFLTSNNNDFKSSKKIEKTNVDISVKENEKTNTKSIDYVGFIPLLLNTINEQNEVVEKSKFEIEELNDKVNDLSEQLQQFTDKYNLMQTQLDEIVANPNKESSTLEPHDIKDDGMELQIYPNPADSQFTIQTATKSSGKIQVNIYNASGQNISSSEFRVFEGQNENTIQTKDWVAGNYYVNVSFNEHTITKNIILK